MEQRSLGQPVSWVRVIDFARSLEHAAWRNDVRPEDGARLVRLLLDFDLHIVGNVRSRGPEGTGGALGPARPRCTR
jgi:hypothetical protein